MARLIQKIKPGSTFIIEESLSVDTQVIYRTDLYKVHWIHNPFNYEPSKPIWILSIDKIGKAPSIPEEVGLENLKEDRFLEVDGKQIY